MRIGFSSTGSRRGTASQQHLALLTAFQKELTSGKWLYHTKRVYSTQVCCDAAANIVRDFNDMYKEFLPGGQLETELWFMSNITWHDYLFGVIALCVVLCVSSQGVATPYVQSAETLQLLQ